MPALHDPIKIYQNYHDMVKRYGIVMELLQCQPVSSHFYDASDGLAAPSKSALQPGNH